MDEIYFHICRHFESLRIYLTSSLQQSRYLATRFGDEITFQIQQFWNQSWRDPIYTAFWHYMNLLKSATQRCSIVLAQSNQIYPHLVELANIKMPVFYTGSAGFIIGAGFGLLIGLSWNHHVISGQRMKAVVCMAYDGLDALNCIDDAVIPTIIKPHQILIQVKSASVDIIDIKISCGYGRFLRKCFIPKGKKELPVVLGRDCAGVIIEIGSNVTKFEIGDKVWVALPFWNSGTLAEYIVVTEDLVSQKPDGLNFEAASSIPYAGCLAYNACVKAGIIGNKEKNKRVLIHSGVSPVGCIACQLAKFYNWEVTVTCSARADPVARTLKADKVIVYGNIEMERKLLQDRFDVVLNTVGGVGHESCLKLCNPNGVVVSTVPEHIYNEHHKFPSSLFQSISIRFKCLSKKLFGNVNEWNGFEFSGETLNKLKALIDQGHLEPVYDKIFEPKDIVSALQYCDSVDTIGKTIISFR